MFYIFQWNKNVKQKIERIISNFGAFYDKKKVDNDIYLNGYNIDWDEFDCHNITIIYAVHNNIVSPNRINTLP